MRYSRLADRALRRALPALLLSFFLITAAISRAQEPADPATPDPAAEQAEETTPADTADQPADTAEEPAAEDAPAEDATTDATATDAAATDTAAAETEAVKSVKLDEAMDSLAAEVVKYFKAEGEPSIIVGPFTGPPGTSAGPRIVKQLKDKITGKLEVVESNACGVSGKYQGRKDEDSGKFVIIVSAEVCDRLGEQTRRLTKRIITSEEEGLTLMGATTSLPLKTAASGSAAGSTPLQEARADAIVESVNNPQVEVAGAIIKAADESPYGVEVLVMTPKGFVPLPVSAEDGVAHVDVKPGQSYAVRLINNSPEPAGVALTIDGINVLAFSQNYKEIGKWVLPAKSRGLIEGWHDVGPRFLSFVVTEYGKSAAAKLGSVDNVGTITAIFTSAFTKVPPKDEPLDESLERDQAATGIGPPVERKVRTLPTSFGAVRASVSVRYTKPDLSDLPPE